MGVEAEFGVPLYRPLEELQFLAPVQSLHFSNTFDKMTNYIYLIIFTTVLCYYSSFTVSATYYCVQV